MSSPAVAIDTSLLREGPGASSGSLGNPHPVTNNNVRDDDEVSVATTALASEVGSFVGRQHDAFLRSVTFTLPEENNNNDEVALSPSDMNEDNHWSLTFRDTTLKKGKKIVEIDSLSGMVALSKLQTGDRLKYINGKKMGPSYNAERATEYMRKCLENERFLSVAVGNDLGRDILVQATVVKPRPDMTYKDMGIVVWVWGQLCIKSIAKDSLFRQSCLKSADVLVSINDIDCERVSPEGFAHIINGLPREITIVVNRGKQRWTGKFG